MAKVEISRIEDRYFVNILLPDNTFYCDGEIILEEVNTGRATFTEVSHIELSDSDDFGLEEDINKLTELVSEHIADILEMEEDNTLELDFK